jgi:FkbM family methyltransferase
MVRKWLLSLLGEKYYLYTLAGTFQRLYRTGILGTDYQDIYFLRHIIREGDHCIDIGAHLGYFTLELSRLVKASGHVYAIEPIGKFNRTIATLLKNRRIANVTLYQNAMGGDDEFVEMGIPQVNNVKKFAYARIIGSSTHLEYLESEKVRNVKGDELFAGIPRLDFIKCDVEGLEVSVFASFIELIRKYRPVILCELGDQQERQRLHDLLKEFSYSVYHLQNSRLHRITASDEVVPVSHNHYFIPAARVEDLLFADPPQVEIGK